MVELRMVQEFSGNSIIHEHPRFADHLAFPRNFTEACP
jgi:hypothetical protein